MNDKFINDLPMSLSTTHIYVHSDFKNFKVILKISNQATGNL